jgi:hypothetical protein
VGRYGLLSYRGCGNLGDEIQSIAAERFLPHVDRYLDRDYLHAQADLPAPLLLIMNGWFTHHPEHWPPSDGIKPLFVAFHIASPAIAQPQHAAYYRRHEPIGCRDQLTLERLRAIGVDAYLSGCLTLTLQNDSTTRTDDIYIVDVAEPLQALIPEAVRRRAIHATHAVNLPAHLQRVLARSARRRVMMWWYEHAPFLRAWKFRRARALLDCYRRAGLVITSRLHCALPCIAFGTPVVVLRKDLRDLRWWGAADAITVYTPHTIARLDWKNVPLPSRPDVTALEARIRQAIQVQEATY